MDQVAFWPQLLGNQDVSSKTPCGRLSLRPSPVPFGLYDFISGARDRFDTPAGRPSRKPGPKSFAPKGPEGGPSSTAPSAVAPLKPGNDREPVSADQSLFHGSIGRGPIEALLRVLLFGSTQFSSTAPSAVAPLKPD